MFPGTASRLCELCKREVGGLCPTKESTARRQRGEKVFPTTRPQPARAGSEIEVGTGMTGEIRPRGGRAHVAGRERGAKQRDNRQAGGEGPRGILPPTRLDLKLCIFNKRVHFAERRRSQPHSVHAVSHARSTLLRYTFFFFSFLWLLPSRCIPREHHLEKSPTLPLIRIRFRRDLETQG